MAIYNTVPAVCGRGSSSSQMCIRDRFLLGEVVFMERALQQLFVLLDTMKLGYCRAVLSLIERELDIGRFQVKATHRSRNGVGIAGLVACLLYTSRCV